MQHCREQHERDLARKVADELMRYADAGMNLSEVERAQVEREVREQDPGSPEAIYARDYSLHSKPFRSLRVVERGRANPTDKLRVDDQEAHDATLAAAVSQASASTLQAVLEKVLERLGGSAQPKKGG